MEQRAEDYEALADWMTAPPVPENGDGPRPSARQRVESAAEFDR
jgi:hypothetical protein